MQLIKIHEDERGSISIVKGLIHIPELTLFKTNKGFARGGCIHPYSDEYCCIVDGSVRYVIGANGDIFTKGMSVLIPKNTPHYFEALEDCIVLEWGATSEEKRNKHSDFRSIVDKINRKEY